MIFCIIGICTSILSIFLSLNTDPLHPPPKKSSNLTLKMFYTFYHVKCLRWSFPQLYRLSLNKKVSTVKQASRLVPVSWEGLSPKWAGQILIAWRYFCLIFPHFNMKHWPDLNRHSQVLKSELCSTYRKNTLMEHEKYILKVVSSTHSYTSDINETEKST